MSSMMTKIADKITGHHHTTGTAANTSTTTTGSTSTTQPGVGSTYNTGLNTGLNSSARNDAALAAGAPAGNQLGGVGPNYSGTNYTAANNGALKEGAQVRDTGLNTFSKHQTTTTTSSNLGRDSNLHNPAIGSSTASNLQSSTASSLHSSTASSLSSTDRDLAATGAADTAMTRSEEHLLVGKERVNVGKAGLHKYVTTEKVSTAVPIIRERAVVEREPITEANRHLAMSGPDFKEAHYEVNLMEERAVAEKEEVPIERVRLRKEVEQTQQYVEADLRKEHIEVIDGTKQIGSAGLTGASSNLAGSQTGFNKSSDYAATGTQRNTMGQELRQDARNAENSARRNL